jgi:hypothetical protein
MGLVATDLHQLRTLNPKRVATIGRLNLYLQKREVREFGFKNYQWKAFCEPFLKDFLGCEEVISIDASDYERASLIYDMNNPLLTHDQQFDAVIDGGSLEHIFNFPVAILNMMRMVRVGGHLYTANPANNQCGHGFYQFSPELFYRILSEVNGYEVVSMLMTEHRFTATELASPRKIVRVRDPAEIGRRIVIARGGTIYLRTLAKKRRHVTEFTRPPQQSDYFVIWNRQVTSKAFTAPIYKRLWCAAYRRLPVKARAMLEDRKFSLANRDFFDW